MSMAVRSPALASARAEYEDSDWIEAYSIVAARRSSTARAAAELRASAYGVGVSSASAASTGGVLGRREHAPLGVGERAHVGERGRLDDVGRDALAGRGLARELEHDAGLAERVLAAGDRADVELA